jgi:hypothetical protein
MGVCEYGQEITISIKDEEFVTLFLNSQFYNNGSTPATSLLRENNE